MSHYLVLRPCCKSEAKPSSFGKDANAHPKRTLTAELSYFLDFLNKNSKQRIVSLAKWVKCLETVINNITIDANKYASKNTYSSLTAAGTEAQPIYLTKS